jgi:phosphoserine phosphatase RsbU/P
VIEIASFEYVEEQITYHPRSDFLLVLLGAVVAAIGLGAIAVHIVRRRPGERFLLWFGLFACPYGIRVLTDNFICRQVFGEPRLAWQFAGAFIDLALIIPALLLFQDFYGEGWRSSVRWVIWSYTAFATAAFTLILVRKQPNLFPTAGIGIVFLLPLVILLGLLKGYQLPRMEDRRVLSFGLTVLFSVFAYDRFARAQILNWRPWEPVSPSAKEPIEPYGVFVLICCLAYAATRRVLGNERELASLKEEMRAAERIQRSILPEIAPRVPGFTIAFRYAPMTAVAGDFYDFMPHLPSGLEIIVADVMGHGVPAALVASMLKAAISPRDRSLDHPGQLIAGLNSTLYGQAKGQYATAVYAYLDAVNQTARYSAAAIRRHRFGGTQHKACRPCAKAAFCSEYGQMRHIRSRSVCCSPVIVFCSTRTGWWRQLVRMVSNLGRNGWRNSLEAIYTYSGRGVCRATS